MRKPLLAALGVLAPWVAVAASPPEGVPLQVRRGFFTETDIGAFLTQRSVSDVSNLQTYLQVGVGYDIAESVSLGVHFGLGASARKCFSPATAPGGTIRCGAYEEDGSFRELPDNFTVTFFDVTAAYRFRLAERFYVAPKIAVGYTLLDPGPVLSDRGTLTKGGLNIGVGGGIEYATSMDHFTVGLDVLERIVVGPMIGTFAVFPRVKYTF